MIYKDFRGADGFLYALLVFVVIDYLAEEDGNIAGAFIVNHIQGEGYQLVDWNIKGSDTEIAVIHLLATAPECQGKGIGRKMLEKAVEICRSENVSSIRLDTLPWNLPGKRLYESFGFQYKGDINWTIRLPEKYLLVCMNLICNNIMRKMNHIKKASP